MDFDIQIERIRAKISKAQKFDWAFKVFGASSHKYVINQPLTAEKVREFEKDLEIHLPGEYFAFITRMGNGGISYQNSAAGPYYGIFPLGEGLDSLVDNPKKYLKQPCWISPELSEEAWNARMEIIDDDALSDEEYTEKLGCVFGGIMPIGSQGCTYYHGLILNGDHAGRVVYLDQNYEKPIFFEEPNFLAWYEAWLDAVLAGKEHFNKKGDFPLPQRGIPHLNRFSLCQFRPFDISF